MFYEYRINRHWNIDVLLVICQYLPNICLIQALLHPIYFFIYVAELDHRWPPSSWTCNFVCSVIFLRLWNHFCFCSQASFQNEIQSWSEQTSSTFDREFLIWKIRFFAIVLGIPKKKLLCRESSFNFFKRDDTILGVWITRDWYLT